MPAPKQATPRTSPVLVANSAPDAEVPRLFDAVRRKYAVGSRCIVGVTPARRGVTLACELRLGQARHVDAQREDPSRLGQPGELLGVAMLARCGHEQLLQIRSAERAHRRTRRGQRKLGERLASGLYADDLSSSLDRAP